MSDLDDVREFLCIPYFCLPSAVSISPNDSELQGHEWDVLRKFDGNVVYGEKILLRADLGEWRKGVIVEV